MKLTGKIIKILANFYYVTDAENKTWECFARARLLKEGKLLFVGDNVEIETSSSSQGVIVDLLGRKNKLMKPPISNIDQVLVIFSTCEPDFDYYNLDRYLSYIRYELANERIIICVNKIDLKKLDISKYYRDSGFDIFYISALTSDNLDILASNLVKKITVLTGPSGVGKSSLIKALAPHENIHIGSVSAIKQGKHITRNVQLIAINHCSEKGFLADTPGFTQFSFAGLDPKKIKQTFNELKSIECAFTDCLHNGEEGCIVDSKVSFERLESYRKILEESRSEINYGSKEETSIKYIGGDLGNKDKKKAIPKIDQETRAKSRKKQKQDLLKYNNEENDDI